MRFLTASSVAALVLLSHTFMAEASNQLPLIEPGHGTQPAPPGYRWYIIRDWEHVYTGKASGVARGASVHAAFDPDQLVFEQNVGDTLRQRSPRVPGEVSHVLLPVSFELPSELGALRADPVPSALAVKQSVDASQIAFVKEPLPPDAPEGYTAYTFVWPRLVFTGTATGIGGEGPAFHFFGSGLQMRHAARPGEPSHILLPSDAKLPATIRRRAQ